MLPEVGNLLAQSGPPDALFTIDKIARVPISKIVILGVVLTALRLGLHFYLTKTPVHQRVGMYKVAKFFNELSDAVVYAAIVVFLIVRPFGLQTFFIPTPSMVDTLRVRDFIIANKFVYRTRDPKAGEIVVFKPPKYALQDPAMAESDFIKRCQGVPGDIVEFKDGVLYRNGEAVEEPYYTISSQSAGYLTPADKSEWDNIKQSLPDFKLVEHDGKVIPVGYDADSGIANVGTLVVEEFWVDPEDIQTLVDAPPAKIPPGHFLMIGDNRNGSDDGRRWGLVTREAIIGKADYIWFPLNRIRKLQNGVAPQSGSAE